MCNKSGKSFEGIIFNDIDQWINDVKNLYGQSELEKALNGIPNTIEMDIAYYPSVNEYMGRSSVQFVINNYRF
jgi:single-stranded-DNA-specific exonuclease